MLASASATGDAAIERMARAEPTSIHDLLPSVLERLSRESTRGSHLIPLWEAAVGPALARNSRPESLVGGTLRVRAATAIWAAELRQRTELILAKVRARVPGIDRLEIAP